MTLLQTVNLGTAPTGSDGDAARAAFAKMNSNVGVLNTQAALVTGATVTGGGNMTNAYVGKRVNVSFSADAPLGLPLSTTCAADQVILIRNVGIGAALLSATGPDVYSGPSKLLSGETLLVDTNGAGAWAVLMRGRTSSNNETVSGTLTVAGATIFNATTALKGDTSLSYATPKLYLNDTAQTGGAGLFRLVSSAGSFLLQHNTATAGDFSSATAPLAFAANDVATFTQRPAWAGVTPWDSGNLTPSLYARLDGSQTYTGGQTQSGVISTVGAFRATADMGSAFSSFATAAAAAFQMDCPNDSSAYYGLRWTHWASRHLAGIAAYAGGSGSSTPSIVFSFAANTNAFVFYASGAATFAGALTQNSDYRIKKNVVAIDPEVALEAVLGSRPIEYDRADYEDSERHVGFIAHELQAQLPLLVTGTKDAVKPAMLDLSAGPAKPGKMVADLQSVNYVGGVPYLFAAMRALKSQLDQAVSRIAELEGPDVNHR
ncbi:tail fiber domain-containing protein [Paraburkholderia domus]|uniref:tail fiber domain-containing protein n=1 Tax=Paraburkholderia domus TaxID=2793075 RepID=UPI00191458BE|nr:tail fiber domain-containing protein [Paraburkholderia domus]MBK5058894.1 tail fiber domain-containing protein [Burkholderia sp. R-70199]CAE6879918.1 hypothetical protein R70199_02464 [Paraburkholderia domus]